MELSILEKLNLQKALKIDLQSAKTVTDILEKLNIQKRIKATIAKLKGTSTTQEKTLYDRLIAGEFYGLDVLPFIKKIKEVIAEIGYDAWKTLKEPCIEYLKRNEKELFTA